MSYIVIGLFPNQVEVDKVLTKLENAGYYDYSISHSEKEILKNADIEKKNGFWNWLFDDNHIDLVRFEYASIDHNTITVHLKTEQDAHIVRDILDHNGAVNVEEKTQNYMTENYFNSKPDYSISEITNARIITKAKNNLFFTNDRKPHHHHEKRIADEIDGLGITKFSCGLVLFGQLFRPPLPLFFCNNIGLSNLISIKQKKEFRSGRAANHWTF